jgi:hypothetical protein
MGRTASRDATVGQPDTGRRPGGGAAAPELEELRYHWGDAYDISVSGGLYTATRRDEKGEPLSDPIPEGLRLQIVADYEHQPVPRDLPAMPAPRCWVCGMADPPREQTCVLGRDHQVGTTDGCPHCGRLRAACAARPCPARRETP